jgi:acyl-CoA synthetase (AMP-forming)/AMP-acid ligase II
MAIIELAEGAEASADEIMAFCASRMANFRVPRYVRFLREWPMTGSGKIQKAKLRETYLAEFGR